MKHVVRAVTVGVAVVGVGAAIVAAMLDGPVRTVFGAVALVCLFTAVYCAAEMWYARVIERIDTPGPPAVTPIPDSPVTEIYDPPSSRNAVLEQTRER